MLNLLMDEHLLFDLAFRRDRVFPIKLACWGALAVFFYAEQLWRAGTLVIGAFVCSFTYPCGAPGTSAGWLSAVFVARLFLISGVTWYAAHSLAWLSIPNWRSRLAGGVAIIAFPFLLLLAAFLAAAVTLTLHLPLEPVFLFENQHLPPWWRQ